MRHIMLDLETCGLRHKEPGIEPVIWSAAIQPFMFMPNGTVALDGSGYFGYLDPFQQASFSRDATVYVSTDTVEWTLAKGDKENFGPWFEAFRAHEAGSSEVYPLHMQVWDLVALHTLLTNLIGADKESQQHTLVWAKGKEFDLALLEYHFSLVGLTAPWHYRNAMCMRTFDGLIRAYGGEVPRPEPSHNAKEDARAQVWLLGAHLKSLVQLGVVK